MLWYWSKIKYEFKFRIWHKYTHPDWYDDEENEPEELYDEKLGYLIYISQWLEEIIEKETELWIKNEYNIYRHISITEKDIIRKIVELNQDKLLKSSYNKRTIW